MEMKTGSQRGICTPMFIPALVTTAKMCNLPKCLSMDERLKKLQCIHIQRDIIQPRERKKSSHLGQHLSKVSQKEKDKCCMISLICVIYKSQTHGNGA